MHSHLREWQRSLSLPPCHARGWVGGCRYRLMFAVRCERQRAMPHGATSICNLADGAVLVLQAFVVRTVAVIAARFRAAAVVGVSVLRSGERARSQISDLRCLSPVALLGCHSPRLLTFEGSTLDSQYHRGHPTRAAHYHLEQPPRSKLAASGGLVVAPLGRSTASSPSTDEPVWSARTQPECGAGRPTSLEQVEV